MSASLHGLATALTHGPSNAVIHTTPPRDNGGDGSSFSPTDMIGAALASCALTTMALIAQREGLDWADAKAKVEKQMVGPPRRIGALVLELELPASIRPEHRPRLEEIARTCPVALSLHPDLQLPMTFRYL
jgi:putative redox protein